MSRKSLPVWDSIKTSWFLLLQVPEKPVVQKTTSSNVRIFKTSEPAKPVVKTTIEKTVVKPAAKPKVDISWVKVGCTVKHKTFGEGKVIEITNGKVTVTFGKAEKKFQYPFAFENGFLTK